MSFEDLMFFDAIKSGAIGRAFEGRNLLGFIAAFVLTAGSGIAAGVWVILKILAA